uniref:Movement protein n=1 Tax=Cucumber mosaic virus TaxID=12305 RepID=Q66122_9BROM|nr:protein 3a [Cucumber mosaic virus]
MAFQGTSRTLTQQSSAATSDDLQKILFSPEAIKKMATECDLGRHHWMRADNAISVRPLVPEVTHIGYTGTTASVCSNWQARFSSKNNNYTHIAAGKTLVLPFNRLAEQTKPSAVARLLKSQLNNIESSQYLLTNAKINQNARSESEDLNVESPPAAIGSSSASRSEAFRPQVVNGL